LLERARQGDRSALERIYQRNLPRLRRWATGRLPPWARELLDTDDLVQQTLLDSLKTVDRFEPRHDGAFQAYIRQALKHRIYHEVQRVRRHPATRELNTGQVDPGPDPLETAVGREQLSRYEIALAKLSEDARTAIIMRLELDYSFPEIAEALGKPSADTARMFVNRAILKLAETMRHDR